MEETQLTVADELHLDVIRVKNMLAQIEDLYRNTMVQGVDYGIIPGCKKPSLWLPGAEKIRRLGNWKYEHETVEIELEDGHLVVKDNCILFNDNGERIANHRNTCSTLESNYRYEQARRLCPECGKPSIYQGKKEYGGGFYCSSRNGGCNQKFSFDDRRITEQPAQAETNPYDKRPTVTMMAQKRAFIAVIREYSGASAIFTQDGPEFGGYVEPEKDVTQLRKAPVTMQEIAAEEPLSYEQINDKQPDHVVPGKPQVGFEIIDQLNNAKPGDLSWAACIAFYKDLAEIEGLTEKQYNLGYGKIFENLFHAALKTNWSSMQRGAKRQCVAEIDGLLSGPPKEKMSRKARGVQQNALRVLAAELGVDLEPIQNARRSKMEKLGVIDAIQSRSEQNET